MAFPYELLLGKTIMRFFGAFAEELTPLVIHQIIRNASMSVIRSTDGGRIDA